MPTTNPIAIAWECLSNCAGDGVFTSRLALRNASGAPLAPGWAVYFNTCRKILPATVSAGYAIAHVNGDLFRLTAQKGDPWLPGQKHELGYEAKFWAISVTDAPLGFYLVPGDGGPVVDLGDPHIVPFARPEQQHRRRDDLVPVADAAARFRQNASLRLLPAGMVGRITPQPVSARFSLDACLLTQNAGILNDPGLAGEAALLRAMLAGLPVRPTGDAASIVLEVAPVEVEGAPSPADEAYLLDIAEHRVLVRGAGPHGVFNGIQTLGQLLARDTGSVPVGRVLDAPRFGYRGVMLDVARHFASVDTVMRLLDCMALYKLNRFHFHLTDDEGWRLAIDTLPELTEVGARRGVAADGRPCLPPSFGSGADIDASAGSGHYSAEDFIAILRYAHARHIEVVPEFNMPGHARAAVVAMRARHDRLLAAGDRAGAEQYLLSDPDDASVYESVQLWRDNVICIALPSVDRFIETVVARVCALYRAAGAPLRVIHTGGDEVPAGAWLGSPRCRAHMAAHGWTDVTQLRDDFVQRCRAILARHGVAFAGWDETALVHADGQHGALPNPRFAGPDFHVYAWNNAWGSGQEDCAYRLVNAGYKVVLANAASLYFDMAYAKDPGEPGYYWAGFVDTRQAFLFCPLDATVTAGSNPMGQPVTAQALAGMHPLDPSASGRIEGVQGQLWGENMRSPERVEYFAAPRLIALAERAWSLDPGWQLIADPQERAACIERAWNEFANRLGQRELARLDRALAYGYRLPPPGVLLDAGVVRANVALPGLALHYTVDGTEPGGESPRYQAPLAAGPGIDRFKIATVDTRGRKSSTVTLNLDDARHE
ncbi:MAG: family 20 glycosylhydrolase [Massilia sp.]